MRFLKKRCAGTAVRFVAMFFKLINVPFYACHLWDIIPKEPPVRDRDGRERTRLKNKPFAIVLFNEREGASSSFIISGEWFSV